MQKNQRPDGEEIYTICFSAFGTEPKQQNYAKRMEK